MDAKNNRYQNFTLLISSIYRNIIRIKDKEMAELGLKGTHVTCLFYLYANGSQTAASLSKMSGEDKAAISRSVEFLEDNGYIRSSDKNYRRQLVLTPKGEDAAKVIADKVDSFVSTASQGLTNEERSILYKALAEIEYNLKQRGCANGN